MFIFVFAHINAFNDKDFVSKRGTINTQNFAMKQPIRTYDEDVSLCVIICKQGAPSQKRITLTMCQKQIYVCVGSVLWALSDCFVLFSFCMTDVTAEGGRQNYCY